MKLILQTLVVRAMQAVDTPVLDRIALLLLVYAVAPLVLDIIRIKCWIRILGDV